MNLIDRNNYEEFFLLYVDGELNPQQKQMVEEFVQANPDLQQELDMLDNAVLQIDNELFFGNKASLYKSAEVGAINTTNYQENFLMYVDNELNETSKASVETFVLQHPALQDEFTLLKQTKLEAELIACPDKESLYKKERRPVIFMWAKRLAVAAAILFFAVMAWMLAPKTKGTVSNNEVTAVTGEKKIAPTVTPKTVNPLNTGTTDNEKADQQLPINVQQLTANAGNEAATKRVEKKNTIIKTSTPQQAPNKAVQEQNNFAVNQQQIAPKQDQVIAPTIVPKEQIIIAKTDKTDNANNNTIVSAVNKDIAALNAKPAVYRELDTEIESDNKIVYIGSMEIKKDKINNIFKQAKKLFSKKKDDDASIKESISSSSRTLR